MPHGLSDCLIVSGDFNIDLLDKNQFSCDFVYMLLTFNTYPAINVPTHAIGHNASFIDNIFSHFPIVLHSGIIKNSFLITYPY